MAESIAALRMAMVRFAISAARERPTTPIAPPGTVVAPLPAADYYLDHLVAVVRAGLPEMDGLALEKFAMKTAWALSEGKPRKKQRPGPKLIPIEQCPTCTALPPLVVVDYEAGGAGGTRPAILESLESVAAQRTADEQGAWLIRSTLRCPACWTFYAAVRSKDEGHTFMDPTHDWERVERITPHAALNRLSEFAAADPVRTTLAPQVPPIVDHLATLVTEGRAPNAHIRAYACACIIHAALSTENATLPVEALLGHAHPAVRTETLRLLLEWATRSTEHVADESPKKRAQQFLESHPPVPRLAEILNDPPEPIWEATTTGTYVERDTHLVALKSIGTAAQLGMPVNDATVDRLADLLTDTRNGRDAMRFEAAWALLWVIGKQPSETQAATIRTRLAAMPDAMRQTGPVAMLAQRVAAAS
jgi:hypothetical protein